jgi:hypothetical protein
MTQLFAFFSDCDPANLPSDTSEDTRRLAELNVPVHAVLKALQETATTTQDAVDAAGEAKASLAGLFNAACWAAFDFAQALGEDSREEYAEAFAAQVAEATGTRLKSALRGFRRDAKLAFIDYAAQLAELDGEARAKALPQNKAHTLYRAALKAQAEEAEAEAEREAHQAMLDARAELEPEAVALVAALEGIEELDVWRNQARYAPRIEAAIDEIMRRRAVLAQFPDVASRNWLRAVLHSMEAEDNATADKAAERDSEIAEAIETLQGGERKSRRAA